MKATLENGNSNALSVNHNNKLDLDLQRYLDEVKNIEKFSEAPVVNSNPFTASLKASMTVQHKVLHAVNGFGSVEMIDKESGEVISDLSENRVFTKRQYVDSDKFTKIYLDRFKQLFDLSSSTVKVFGYILNEMQKVENVNSDIIYFDMEDCKDYLGFSQSNMIYRGLTELLQHGFIAKAKKPSHFYIDSKTAFNGNRIVIMEEYERKENEFFQDRRHNKNELGR